MRHTVHLAQIWATHQPYLWSSSLRFKCPRGICSPSLPAALLTTSNPSQKQVARATRPSVPGSSIICWFCQSSRPTHHLLTPHVNLFCNNISEATLPYCTLECPEGLYLKKAGKCFTYADFELQFEIMILQSRCDLKCFYWSKLKVILATKLKIVEVYTTPVLVMNILYTCTSHLYLRQRDTRTSAYTHIHNKFWK